MNLILTDNLKNNLAKIKAELALYDEFTRLELFNHCINQRLIHTLELYNVKTDQLIRFYTWTTWNTGTKSYYKTSKI